MSVIKNRGMGINFYVYASYMIPTAKSESSFIIIVSFFLAIKGQ